MSRIFVFLLASLFLIGAAPVCGQRAPLQFDSARVLTEINLPPLDGHFTQNPWLSRDGLRLYFTISAPNQGGVYVASRPALTAPFGAPQQLIQPGCWPGSLSDDERVCWYSTSPNSPMPGPLTEIAYRVRATDTSRFGPERRLTVRHMPLQVSTGDTWLGAPRLSNDSTRIYVTHFYPLGDNYILQFRFTGRDSVEFEQYAPVDPFADVMPGSAQPFDNDRQMLFGVWASNSVSGVPRVYNLHLDSGAVMEAVGLPPVNFAMSRIPSLCYRPEVGAMVVERFIETPTSNSAELWYFWQPRTPQGVGKTPAPEQLQLAPNPAHGTMQVKGAPAGPVQVLDALGRVVLTANAATATETTLDLSPLAPGIYTVRAGAATRRLVVE